MLKKLINSIYYPVKFLALCLNSEIQYSPEGYVTDENYYYNIGKLATMKYSSDYGYDGEQSYINYHGKEVAPALKDYIGGLGKYLTGSTQSEIKDHPNAHSWSNVKTLPSIHVYRKDSRF